MRTLVAAAGLAVMCVGMIALTSQHGGAIVAEEVVFVRPVMMERQRRIIRVPRTQSLDIDFLPEKYDASFGTEPESYDGACLVISARALRVPIARDHVLTPNKICAAPEFQVAFNGADPDGASWRQYVPMAVWSDQDWFDDEGNYLGRSGGPDTRKTTVTRR